MPMAKLFICKIFSVLSFVTLTSLGLVYFFSTVYALEFQCYQKFNNSKPFVLTKFAFYAKELHFELVHSRCIATAEIKIQFSKNQNIVFEKQITKHYHLPDEKDPLYTLFMDSLFIHELDYGEYEVHFSLEQFQHAYYKKIAFFYENQWYRVNIHDVELFNKKFLPIFQTISETEDSISIQFTFDTEHLLPLTIRVQVFTEQNESSNPYSIAYQSIQQITTTINLKKGRNIKLVNLLLNKVVTSKYFIEINFFEEENFVMSKRIEVYALIDELTFQEKLRKIMKNFQDLGISFPQNLKVYENLQNQLDYLEGLLKYSKNDLKKIKILMDLGKPNKTFIQNKKEVWVYYKYNRKIEFET